MTTSELSRRLGLPAPRAGEPTFGFALAVALFFLVAPPLAADDAPALVPPAELKAVPARALPQVNDPALAAALARHRGQPVLVNFWATWCPPCREELPALQQFAQAARARGLAVVTVAVADRRQAVDDLLWELGVDLPVVLDPEQTISRAWGAYGLPTSYLLDRRHRLRYRGVGVIDWSSAGVQGPLRAVLAPAR